MPVDVNSAAFRLWQLLNGTSFHGCIRNLYINNELQDFTKTRMTPGVVPGCEPCRKLYCLHGICQPAGAQGPVCHCEPGWAGPHCDQPHDSPCQGHKCAHGLCLPLDALSYSCQCHEGYQGALCNQPAEPPDPCRRRPCRGPRLCPAHQRWEQVQGDGTIPDPPQPPGCPAPWARVLVPAALSSGRPLCCTMDPGHVSFCPWPSPGLVVLCFCSRCKLTAKVSLYTEYLQILIYICISFCYSIFICSGQQMMFSFCLQMLRGRTVAVALLGPWGLCVSLLKTLVCTRPVREALSTLLLAEAVLF
uniref:Uncharacterized protein n=1 Tax=Nothoprocta perdicaria TaxID=30464 RepID=A0A8C6ZEV2_NOTPE